MPDPVEESCGDGLSTPRDIHGCEHRPLPAWFGALVGVPSFSVVRRPRSTTAPSSTHWASLARSSRGFSARGRRCSIAFRIGRAVATGQRFSRLSSCAAGRRRWCDHVPAHVDTKGRPLPRPRRAFVLLPRASRKPRVAASPFCSHGKLASRPPHPRSCARRGSRSTRSSSEASPSRVRQSLAESRPSVRDR